MTGFLIVNHYLNGEKFDVLHKHLVSSALKFGINLEIKTNLQVQFLSQKPSFALFWDKDVNLARILEKQGIPVFNSARAIELCDDKAKTYAELLGVVDQPKTLIAPKSFFKTDYSAFVDEAISVLGLPLVFKECFGSFGEQVFLCQTKDDILSHIGEKPFLLQEFIEASAGEDIRIEVVDGECVCAMKRSNNSDFRANITNGGTAVAYNPTEQERTIAVKACKALGLDFGGVDILKGSLVCEVNSNAHIINLMNATGIDLADKIFESILKKL
ncbi:MAG: RimK family alpha-L-glutamate ligase [Eubacterium sp.]